MKKLHARRGSLDRTTLRDVLNFERLDVLVKFGSSHGAALRKANEKIDRLQAASLAQAFTKVVR